MKNLYPKLVFLLLPTMALAQLTVKPNTSTASIDEVYIYNKSQILYVKGTVNLIKGGIPAGKSTPVEGNIYLRDEGQLIQGTNSDTNVGSGNVSVYQIGVVNQFDYHYWASPVNDITGGPSTPKSWNLNNQNDGGIFEALPDGTDERFAIEPTFVTGYSGSRSPMLQIAKYWINVHVAGKDYRDWKQVNDDVAIPMGQGFTMKGVSGLTTAITGQVYDFRGRPNNGTIAVAVGNGLQSLVGNPYPSAMDMNYYLLYNSKASSSAMMGCATVMGSTTTLTSINSISGDAFYWDSDKNVQSHYLEDYKGGYGSYSPQLSCASGAGIYMPATYAKYDKEGAEISGSFGNGISYNRRYAPIGQGFFVEGRPAGTTGTAPKVVARNEFRIFKTKTADGTQFRKPTNLKKNVKNKSFERIQSLLAPNRISYDIIGNIQIPTFKIEASVNNTYVRSLATCFMDIATKGVDGGGDASNFSPLRTDVNFAIEGSDKPYLINILPYDLDSELDLQISGNLVKNTFIFKVSEINFTSEGIWVWDKNDDTYHDILTGTYEVTLPKGNHDQRFAVVFKDKKSESLDIAEEIEQSFEIFQNNRFAELHIMNPSGATFDEIAVYDMAGRLVAGKLNEGTNNEVTISSSNWADGVYVVRVVTIDNVEFSKKVSVINKN